jgi:siroheme synthase (precorrin-2 oxidase/ferrochelatase)
MTNPLVHAFFIGRALAETLNEELERALTDALGEIGKFDAEQRERLRQFVAQVEERAARAEQSVGQASPSGGVSGSAEPQDLQAIIDNLRAEIAQLRTELQRYRSRSV